MKNCYYLTCTILIIVLLPGCAGKITSSVSPDQNINQVNNIYIIKNASVEYRGNSYHPHESTAFYKDPAGIAASIVLSFVEVFLTEKSMSRLGSIAPCIKKELEKYGINALIVEEKDLPPDSKIVIRYLDVWMWDFKPVLYELDIAFINTKDNMVIASTHYKIGDKEFHDFPSPEKEIPKMFKTLFN